MPQEIDYYQLWKNELVQRISKETRMSIRQVMLLRWIDIEPNKIRTRDKREVQISTDLYKTLLALPCRSGWVFSNDARPPRATTKKHAIQLPKIPKLQISWN